MNSQKKRFFLFDVDGTLTHARAPIEERMVEVLRKLKSKENISLGVVGGSDYRKIIEQIKYPEMFDFIFSENGVVAYRDNEQFYSESITEFLGEEKIQQLIDYCLVYIANLRVPKKRGTFIELRNGMINISPIGRNCTREERTQFCKYNAENSVLRTFQMDLMRNFSQFDLTFSIGGQISIDCFPRGWDKTFCLRHIEGLFAEVFFFGDKTEKGGNDYEIFHDERVRGFSVKSPEETEEIIKSFLDP
ncbi:phosphomannomutase, putative [Plasmodium knowlesi strain H]|uniref:Phosphomannomutase n=3 Tax=Plasmodium knowlesi TaxID=5850 RepID=A0A5E7WWM6_PLAKH|nr:phosphomannomutase, putative [Plasmodium knowlesi strain H]OTN68174.1 Phosphomannomutase [Plasmodium knowlesi]CAA9987066.1 phosphomannomutase, putative [Plasmodium knowlesi strain H]SBO23788.1 phosphomannomutase, putative [Plasmodium knowlesi strain H]SBO25520.1 phosphomannomutase, putative [Plasmodium knowlesi strain H]VVS76540.1 phosphomannomutase, putative [Plasmodium knowlesi strain H]